MRTLTFKCAYGASGTHGIAYAMLTRRGWWYVVDGSVNVNLTYADLEGMASRGRVDVESLPDLDFFTAAKPVESEDDLWSAVFND